MISVVRSVGGALPWRIRKVGTWTPTAASTAVTGWEVDPASESSDILTSSGIIVPFDVPSANINATYMRTTSGGSIITWQARLTRNGALIGSVLSGNGGNQSLSPSAVGVALTEGMVISLEAVSANPSITVAAAGTTFIEITAAS